MRISLYVHAWQALLMFIAGILSVLASQVGYLRSGGGEELLQQALVFLPTKGKKGFDSLEFNLAESRMSVLGLYHEDITDGANKVSGLRAERCEVRLDLWPRVRVDSIHVSGVRDLGIAVESGFLQRSHGSYPGGLPFPLYFEGVDLSARIGDGPVVKLKDCSGVLRQRKDPKDKLIGEFRLSKLNDQPFDFKLTAHADGRWECRGTDLSIDTRALQRDTPKVLSSDPLDPVALLVRGLLTGEFGARGNVSVRVDVMPASASDKTEFACQGEVTYQDLSLRFPPREAPAARAVPDFLAWMLGGSQGMAPHWLVPDSVTSGPKKGRLSFHMYGNRLDFVCDEGSVFIPRYNGQDRSPLESFRGYVITDEEHRPKHIALRGFLGDRLNCELKMESKDKGVRVFNLVFRPRVIGSETQDKDVALWHFRSRIEDYSQLVEKSKDPKSALLKFQVEMASSHCPDPLLLPPGVVDFSGLLRVKGRYLAGRVLTLDEILWEKGGLVFGGKAGAVQKTLQSRQGYGPFFGALRQLWGSGSSEWRLQDVDLKGGATVRFDEQVRWVATELTDWRLSSGRVLYRGLTTDLGAEGIEVQGELRKPPAKPDQPTIRINAKARKGTKNEWGMSLNGQLLMNGDGELRFKEKDVPSAVHPERQKLKGTPYESGWFDKRINRTTLLRVKDGKFQRETLPKKK